MADRVATYRWQLTPTEGFDEAAASVPTLAELGVSHLYLSPVAEAVPGSPHGYDVTDPTRLREELGGAEAFARLSDACRDAGLHLLVDIVPNHLAAHDTNPWWWDVLRLGSASRFAEVFDIDWSVTDPLLLPVLGDHYGRELEAGQLQLERGRTPERLAVVRYHERTFPLRPETEGAVLAEVARQVDDDVLGVAARLLARSEGPAVDQEARAADLAVAARTVWTRLADPDVAAALDAELAAIAGDPERLDAVLAHQHHRLARWTLGDAQLGYRRFFDVDALAATRMGSHPTFELMHRLPAELLTHPTVDGLRVDHIDGLEDPARYLRNLRGLVGPDAWLVVEKITRHDEDLPPWPVEGTTGYEVADLLGRWLTDPVGARVLRDAWAERTGERRAYREVALEARREVLSRGFAADLDRVVDALQAVCTRRRRHRDHARTALQAAVVELAVHTQRYRTYVVPAARGEAAVDDIDRAVIASALSAARTRATADLDPELLELLAAILAGDLVGEPEALVVTRFQQLTGPVAAKGEEDTALYRWLPLPHRCEVGADPSLDPIGPDAWHAACTEAQARWPQRLTTLSTHDTKRSADARARLATLTARPDDLLDAFDRWWAARPDPTGALDPGTGWMAFHALLAAWPIDAQRAWAAVQKSAREAGLRTSWTQPDEAFEDDLRTLVEAATREGEARAILVNLVALAADATDGAALAQLLAQLLAPGVPDLYQGAEAWDRSLVDPDNRRPPDPAARSALVGEAGRVDASTAWADPALRRSGLPRTIVVRTALAARRRHAAAVGPGGDYAGVVATGPDADRVLAFTRGAEPELLVVVVAPGRSTDVTATVGLPAGEWTDLFTGEAHRGAVDVAKLLAGFPVALLER